MEPWKRLVIHELVEYKFEDWVKQIAFGSRTSGGAIPTMQWSNGVVFSPVTFQTTNAVVLEQLNGTLHWSSVSFAVRDEFVNQFVCDNATINMVDVSANEVFRELTAVLRSKSKYLDGGAGGSG